LDGTTERVFVLRRPNISAAASANSSTPLATLNPMTAGPKGFCPNGISTEPSPGRLNAATLVVGPEEVGGRAEAGSEGATDQEELEKAI
jgi:hypothetical protein